jgi:transcriptional regulator with XRE-family HTH domain
MGRSPRDKPKKLAAKMLKIRRRLGFSQTQMSNALGLKVHYAAISQFESGTREPSLIMLRYARLARVPIETLVDDEMKLPK